MTTARVVRRLPSAQGEAKRLRWQRIAMEAARQCGHTVAPHLEPVIPFAELVWRLPGTVALIPTLAAKTTPRANALTGMNALQHVMLLIGPEGDFTREEVTLATRCGARAVSLGRLTLRSETAAIATLAVIQHALGEL